MLGEHLAQALHDAAVQLPVEQHVVEDPAAVVDRDVAQHLDRAGVAVDLHLGDMGTAGESGRRRNAAARLELGGASIRFHVTTSANLGKVVATHLHQGAAGVNGPMVVELNPGFTGTVLDGSIPVDGDLSVRVLANPSQYYVKLHSLKFPGGAIRGQLHSCGSGNGIP